MPRLAAECSRIHNFWKRGKITLSLRSEYSLGLMPCQQKDSPAVSGCAGGSEANATASLATNGTGTGCTRTKSLQVRPDSELEVLAKGDAHHEDSPRAMESFCILQMLVPLP